MGVVAPAVGTAMPMKTGSVHAQDADRTTSEAFWAACVVAVRARLESTLPADWLVRTVSVGRTGAPLVAVPVTPLSALTRPMPLMPYVSLGRGARRVSPGGASRRSLP